MKLAAVFADESEALTLCQSLDIDEHGNVIELPQSTEQSSAGSFHQPAPIIQAPNRLIQFRRIGLEASLIFWEDLVNSEALLAARTLVRRSNLTAVDIALKNYKMRRSERGQFEPFVIEKLLEDCFSRFKHDAKLFYKSERDVDEIPSGSPLALVLAMWCLNKGELEAELIDPLFDRFDFGTHIRFREESQQGEFIVETPGSGLRDAGVGWFQSSVGRPVTSMPDRTYGIWTTNSYRECMNARIPKLHRISADIRWDNRSLAKRDYYRLAIPFEDSAGNQKLFCAMSDIEF